MIWDQTTSTCVRYKIECQFFLNILNLYWWENQIHCSRVFLVWRNPKLELDMHEAFFPEITVAQNKPLPCRALEHTQLRNAAEFTLLLHLSVWQPGFEVLLSGWRHNAELDNSHGSLPNWRFGTVTPPLAFSVAQDYCNNSLFENVLSFYKEWESHKKCLSILHPIFCIKRNHTYWHDH